MLVTKLLHAILLLMMLFFTGCGSSIRITPETPTVARDLSPYVGKRAVVLAFRGPEPERGLGPAFASVLHRELLAAGPFGQVALHLEADPFGLQSHTAEELATAAALGSELGFDVAVVGHLESFAYSRNSLSSLVVSVWLLDTVTGEVVHAEQLTARAKARSSPPVWQPGLSEGARRDEIFEAIAVEIVRRLTVRWELR